VTVEGFIRSSIKVNRTPESAIWFARQFGDEFAAQVEAAIAKGAYRLSPGAVFARIAKVRRQMLADADIKPVTIRNKGEHLATAIRAMFKDLDVGRKPSALTAAKQPELNEQQIKKLAYRTPIKGESVQTAVDLQSGSTFVQGVLQDAGLTGIVVNNHSSLSRLASVLADVHRSLCSRAEQFAAAVIVDSSDRADMHGRLETAGVRSNSRGTWHIAALELKLQGRTANQIARLLDKPLNAVEKVLKRKAWALADNMAKGHRLPTFGGCLAGGISQPLQVEKGKETRDFLTPHTTEMT